MNCAFEQTLCDLTVDIVFQYLYCFLRSRNSIYFTSCNSLRFLFIFSAAIGAAKVLAEYLTALSQTSRSVFAGTPAISARAGTFFVTTAPAATVQYSPSSCPQTIVAFAPIVALFLTSVFFTLRDPWGICARGARSFVKTQEGFRRKRSPRAQRPS